MEICRTTHFYVASRTRRAVGPFIWRQCCFLLRTFTLTGNIILLILTLGCKRSLYFRTETGSWESLAGFLHENKNSNNPSAALRFMQFRFTDGMIHVSTYHRWKG